MENQLLIQPLFPKFAGGEGRIKKERLNISIYWYSLNALLVAERVRGADVATSVPGEKRYIANEFESPISTIIYGSKVAAFVWLDDPIAFLLESKEAAIAYRNYFTMLWKAGKR